MQQGWRGGISSDVDIHQPIATVLITECICKPHSLIALTPSHSSHLHANLLKLLNAVAEGDDFGGADKGPIQGVKEEDNVPAQRPVRSDERSARPGRVRGCARAPEAQVGMSPTVRLCVVPRPTP